MAEDRYENKIDLLIERSAAVESELKEIRNQLQNRREDVYKLHDKIDQLSDKINKTEKETKEYVLDKTGENSDSLSVLSIELSKFKGGITVTVWVLGTVITLAIALLEMFSGR